MRDDSPVGFRLSSFRYASRGILSMLRTEPNARIHAAATVLAVAAGFGLEIGRAEWLAVVLVIGAVWTAESFNTACEALCDLASPERHPLAERAKDVAAGAVLVAALTAVVVGLLVFGPRLAELART
jgi:diacylglycerol kinase (ATP)